MLAGAANESEEGRRPLATKAISRSLNLPEQILPQSVSRAAITGAYRRAAETDAVPMLLEQARLPDAIAAQAQPGVSVSRQAA